MRAILLLLAALVVVFPVAGWAQAPSGDQGNMDLSIKRAPKRPATSVVRPVTPPQVVEQGVAQAQTEVERLEREQQLLEAVRPQPPARPDLQQDVVGGIQSRNLQRAIGR